MDFERGPDRWGGPPSGTLGWAAARYLGGRDYEVTFARLARLGTLIDDGEVGDGITMYTSGCC